MTFSVNFTSPGIIYWFDAFICLLFRKFPTSRCKGGDGEVVVGPGGIGGRCVIFCLIFGAVHDKYVINNRLRGFFTMNVDKAVEQFSAVVGEEAKDEVESNEEDEEELPPLEKRTDILYCGGRWQLSGC